MKVHIITGVGAWKAEAEVHLITAPHTGDFIALGEYGDIVVECQRVTISEDEILVEEKRHFDSEEEAQTLQRYLRER